VYYFFNIRAEEVKGVFMFEELETKAEIGTEIQWKESRFIYMITITTVIDTSSWYYGEVGAHIMAAAYGGSARDRFLVRTFKFP